VQLEFRLGLAIVRHHISYHFDHLSAPNDDSDVDIREDNIDDC
jgi:hypothetical protein